MDLDTIQFEGVKMGLRQSKDGYVLSLAVHPDDIPDDLVRDFVGSRYMTVMVRLGDDEQPMQRKKQNNYVQIAGLLCRDRKFQDFVSGEFNGFADDEELTAKWLCNYLGIDSRSELPNNEAACKKLIDLKRDYEAWKS
jgi:hypothetical protein